MWFILVVIIAIITFQIVSKQKYKKLETEVLKKLGFSNWNIVSYLDEQVIVKSRQTLEKYDAVKFFKENKEKLEIKYITECENKENYLSLLKQRRKLDIIKGFTTKGIHRDDFKCFINDKEIEIYGSQGQHRTAILSLKLAELYVIYDEIGEYPILLLDDFMSELDEKRRKSFLSYIKDTQVIITCTDKMELDNIKLFNVINGEICKLI